MKRTLYFTNPFYLSTRQEQLVIKQAATGQEQTVPIEDIGFLILDSREITVSSVLMQRLADYNVAVVFCNETHHPISMMMPLDHHQTQAERFKHQLLAAEPLKKQLWAQTIKMKIKNQQSVFKWMHKETAPFDFYIRNVKSGDVTNEEGQASRHYWRYIFEGMNLELLNATANEKSGLPLENNMMVNEKEAEDYDGSPLVLSNSNENELKDVGNTKEIFRRDRFGNCPNNFLNFGYTILRSAVARALVGSGLLPTLGIHHRNKYNAYQLADDIMEPYRPWVDKRVVEVLKKFDGESELTKSIKVALMGVLTEDVEFDDGISPMMLGIGRTTASLAKCFLGEEKEVLYPKMK
jgi:CRISPR-associated protein Cas1